MLSFERRHFLIVALGLPVAGCGLTPAYAPGGAGQALRGQVRTQDPTNAAEFDFVAAFEERLGRAQAARYDLAYQISLSERGSARVAGLGETRVSLIGTLTYSLTEQATGANVTSGQVRNFTNYSTTSTQLATLRAREDAQRRLMRILADQVATRLLAAMTA